MATNDRSMGFNVFFTESGVESLKRVLAELSGQLDTLGKKVVAPELDIDDRKGKEKVGAFARDLQTRIDAAIKALPGIELKAEATDADRRIAELRAELVGLSNHRIGLDLEAPGVHERLEEISTELKHLGAESANIQVKADTAEASAELDGLGSKHPHVELEVDTAKATTQLDVFTQSMRTKVEAAIRALPAIELRADSSDVDQRIVGIRAELEELSNRTIRFEVDSTEAHDKIRALARELDDLSARSSSVQVRADTAEASAKLAELDGHRFTATLSLDTAAADATVSVFAQEVRSRIIAAVRDLPDVVLRADTTDIERRIAAIRGELTDLADRRINIGIDDEEALTKIRALSAELTDLGARSESIRVRTDTGAAVAELDALSRHPVTAEVHLDTTDAQARIAELATVIEARLDRAIRSLPSVTLSVESSTVERRIDEIRAELMSLSGHTISVDVDIATASEKIRRLAAELTDLGAMTPDVTVRANTTEAAAALLGVKTSAGDLDGRTIEITVDTGRGREDVDAFVRSLEERITTAIQALPEIRITADSTDVDRRITDIRAQLAALADRRIGVEVTTADAAAAIRALVAELDELSTHNPHVTATADTVRAATTLDGIRRDIAELDGQRIVVGVDVNTEGARTEVGAFARDLQIRIDTAIRDLAPVKLKVDDTDIGAHLAAIRTELTSLSDRRIGIGVNADEAFAQVEALTAALDALGVRNPTPRVTVDDNAALVALDSVQRKLDDLAGRRVTAHVDVDSAHALAQVDDFVRELQTRIQAAVRSLPHIELHADATDVDRTLFAVNTELRSLSDRRIGIDVSEADAVAKIAALRRELDELSARHVNIPVTLGVDRAAADDLRNMLDRLTDKSITIETHSTDATAQINDLWSKLVAIGKLNPETTVTVHTAEALAGIEHVSVALDHMQAKLDGIDTGKITALGAALKGINTQPITVTPNVNTTATATKLAGLTKPISVPVRAQPATTTGTPLGAPQTATTATALTLTANSNPFDIKIAQANIKLDELRAKKVSPELDLKISALEAKRDQAIAALAVLQRTNVTPKATVDMIALFADLGKARAQLADLNTKRVSPEIDLKVAHGEAQLTQFRMQLDALKAQKVNPEIDFYIGKSEESLARTNAQIDALSAKKATPEVLADISRFQLKAGTIEDTIARLNALRATPKLDADIAALEAKIALAEERLRTLNAQKASPKLDAEADVLESKIEKLVERIHILDAETSNSKLGADITAGLINIDTLEERIRGFERQRASSKLDVDIVAAEANIVKLTAERDAFITKSQTGLKIPVDVDAGQFAQKLQSNIEAAVKAIPNVPLTSTSTEDEKRIKAIRDELASITDKKVGVGISADEAIARAKELAAELDKLGAKSTTVQVKADTAAARTALLDVGKAADDAGNKGKSASANLGLNTALVNRWQQLGAAILVAATAAGPALLALGGVATAGVTGVVQTGLGVKTLFSGVGTGATAIETADKQQTSQAATLAAQQVTSANAVIAANQAVASSIRGVSDATRAAATANTNADRTVSDSKRSVTDAITAEVDAQRSAGVSEANAVYAEGQAEQSLQNAQQSEMRAQQALTDARQAATRQLENLNLQVKDAALAEQAAVLGIEQAQENLNKLLDTTAGTQKTLIQAEEDYARAVATGTKAEQDKARAILDTIRTKAQGPSAELARDEAQLAYEQAVQHLQDQQVQNKQLAEDKATADKRGVDGNLQVVAAQQGVTAATQATQNAQHSLAQAQAAVIETQRAGLESVAKAQEQVTKANEAQATAQAAQIETQRAGLESIAKANEAQVAAQRSLENATAQAAKVGVTSLDTLKSALDQLSPAGRLFAYFLHDTLTPQLHDIRDAVQAAGLPKMQTALENLGTLSPTITAGLAGTASVIGDLAIQGSKMVTSGPWKADFATVMARNNRVLGDFGNAGLSTADAFRSIAASAGPLEEKLAKLGAAGAQSFDTWIQGLRNSGQLDQFFHNAGDELIQLVKVMGELATAAISLIKAVHPISGVVVELIGHLADWIGMFARANPTVIETVAALGTLFAVLSKFTGVSLANIIKGEAFAGLATNIQIASGSLGTLGTKIESAAGSLGNFASKVPGLATVGGVVANDMGNLGKAVGGAEEDVSNLGKTVGKIGTALPIVGAAVIAFGFIWDQTVTSLDAGTAAMLKGGAAAEQMKAKVDDQLTGFGKWINSGLHIVATTDDMTKSMNDQLAAMDPLTRAQTIAAREQNNYLNAVNKFGLGSTEATTALGRFKDATAELNRQQEIVKNGLDNTNHSLTAQRDLLLGGIQAEIRFKDIVAQLNSQQQQVSDARLASDKQVAAAEQTLNDARASSARSVVSAEEALTRAQQASLGVQDDLNRSRQQAADALSGMNRSLEGSALDEESARIAVSEAQDRLTKGKADSTLSATDRQRLDLDARRAALALKDAIAAHAALAKETDAANKAGIDGSSQVVAAKQREKDAANGIKDAEKSLADARAKQRTDDKAAEQAFTDVKTKAAKDVQDAIAKVSTTMDLNTTAGRANATQFQELIGVAQADVTQMGKNGASLDEISSKSQWYHDRLVDIAVQYGMTKTEAEKYVNTLFGIPGERNTTLVNNAGIASEATQTYINSLNLAQGTYVATVIANVDPANRVINDFIRNSEAIQITLQLAAGIGAVANRPRATGGIDLVAPMAAGGLRVMDTGIANIVSPNTPTLMGDHPTVNESYIPWTRTQRTDQIFDATATGIGRTVLPRAVSAPTPMAAGGINGPTTLDSDPRRPVAVEVGPRTLAMFTDLANVLCDHTTTARSALPLAPPPVVRTIGPDPRDTTTKYRDVALNVTPVVIRQVTQNAANLVTAGARIVQPTAGGVVRGTSGAVRTGDAGMNPTAFAGVIETAITRALSNRPAGPPVALSPGAEAAMTRAVSSGVHGAELRIRDDGQGGIARIANRQNRDSARR